MVSRARRRKKKQRARQIAPAAVALALIILIILIIGISFLVKKYSSSKELVDYEEYFSIAEEDDVVILLGNEVLETKAKLIDGEVYIDTDLLYEGVNARFYWDSQENVLLYALPTELVTVPAGSKEYTVGKNKQSESYAPVRLDGDTAYVALDFIQDYTAMTYEYAEEPVQRVHINVEFGTVQTVEVKKDTQVRDKAGIKRPILTEVSKGEKLYVLEEPEEIKDWTRVRTENGFVGYIQDKRISAVKEETLVCDYAEPVYENISKDYKINMVWHQVTSKVGNDNIYKLLASTKGVNTVSPTWIRLKDNDGGIESLAEQDYVDYCHQNGIEVWALVEDITYLDTIIDYEIFSRTSSRQRLVSNLIAQAIQYDLDGLNLDMEYINTQTGQAYLQFIRELSIMCRLNGITLSVDNYVPTEYSAHYDRAEQAVFADYIIIMGYDETPKGSTTAGSVASIDFVRNGIVNTLKEVPAEKVINAIPFYTRVWKLTPSTSSEAVDGYTAVCEAEVGMSSAERYGKVNAAETNWSQVHGQYFVEYENGGNLYQIWLEEERSVEEKMKLIKEYDLAGVSAWKLGLEKSSVWDVILKYVN
ncbi:MAG: SH3 domain-containing protein [Lachnospiraceae bacterium]|nr:SH3 domain-containing protein [Lachnospiraceae bacterium]